MLHFLVLVTLTQGPNSGPSAEQFQRILREQHAAIRDLSFVYEGTLTSFVSAPGEATGAGPSQTTFQGRYLANDEGATYLDVYLGTPADATFVRKQSALIGDRLSSHSDIPDEMPTPMLRRETKGSGGSINIGASPHRFLYLWWFREHPNLGELGYKYLGSEDIDGHSCVKLQVIRWVAEDDLNRNVFWIDLRRGGHPLRVEMYRQGEVLLRVRDIRLAQYKAADGRDVWLPVHAKVETLEGRENEPTALEVYDVVTGSVRINGGIAPHQFEIQPVSAAVRTSEFRPLQAELDSRRAQTRQEIEAIRTDPEGIQQRLDEMLEEAEQQARLLEASSVARQRFGWTGLMSSSLVTLGIALILVVLLLRWRWGS